MSNKKVKTRIQNKFDLKENWDKASNFIPLKGEIVTIAPNVGTSNSEAVFKKIPHRIKIGDGEHTLQNLSYLGEPIVKLYDTELTGFNSVTMLPSGDVELALYLSKSKIHTLNNLENQEYFHHRLFARTAGDLRSMTVTLKLSGDGNTVENGVDVSEADIVLKPTKCLLPSWNTGMTVSSSQYDIPNYQVISQEDITFGSLEYTLTLPADKDAEDNYIYNNGAFQIDISCFLAKTDEGEVQLGLHIENDYLALCSKVSI